MSHETENKTELCDMQIDQKDILLWYLDMMDEHEMCQPS
jgi:hypothetical protein